MPGTINAKISYHVSEDLNKEAKHSTLVRQLSRVISDAIRKVSEESNLTGDVTISLSLETEPSAITVPDAEETSSLTRSFTRHYHIPKVVIPPTADDIIVADKDNDSWESIYQIDKDGQSYYLTGKDIPLLDLGRPIGEFGKSQIDRVDLLAPNGRITGVAIAVNTARHQDVVFAVPISEGIGSSFGDTNITNDQSAAFITRVVIGSETPVLVGDNFLTEGQSITIVFNFIGSVTLTTGMMQCYGVINTASIDDQTCGAKIIAYKTEMYFSKG